MRRKVKFDTVFYSDVRCLKDTYSNRVELSEKL